MLWRPGTGSNSREDRQAWVGECRCLGLLTGSGREGQDLRQVLIALRKHCLTQEVGFSLPWDTLQAGLDFVKEHGHLLSEGEEMFISWQCGL